MDNGKTGALIRRLRTEAHMTQRQLAAQLHVSDKAVSKWERGMGCPDVSLIAELSRVFEVDMQSLLAGELNQNRSSGGNMRRMRFYVCPACGNLVCAVDDLSVSCCGKRLKPMTPRKAEADERLSVRMVENDYFIFSEHEMTRDHYITFVALLTSDTVMLRKQYPEWDLQLRIPAFAHGRLLWHCSRHGLFYQNV